MFVFFKKGVLSAWERVGNWPWSLAKSRSAVELLQPALLFFFFLLALPPKPASSDAAFRGLMSFVLQAKEGSSGYGFVARRQINACGIDNQVINTGFFLTASCSVPVANFPSVLNFRIPDSGGRRFCFLHY